MVDRTVNAVENATPADTKSMTVTATAELADRADQFPAARASAPSHDQAIAELIDYCRRYGRTLRSAAIRAAILWIGREARRWFSMTRPSKSASVQRQHRRDP